MARLLCALLLLLPTLAFAETRYLVELRGTPSKAQFERLRRDATVAMGKRGVEVAPRYELSRIFHGVAVTLDDAAAEAVRRLPYVAALHEDREVQAFGTDVTHLERIGAKQVWASLGLRGAGVTIAVIDTGVDHTHPAFANRYLGGYDFIDKDDEPNDPHGHGTHVAGTALGDGFGVAPAAKLLAYRVLDESGSGYASDVMAALERALDPNGDGDLSDRADVINLSLGSMFGTADSPDALAVDAAVEAGAVVVLAAGNFGGTQSLGTPATSRLGIAVGNADANDAILYDSSYGPVAPALDLKPDLAAPGEEILSARSGGGTRVMSGTSMASPHVAGAAALLLELHPEWTPEQVKATLIGTAKPMADEVMKRGGGRLDVHRAATSTAFVSPASFGLGRMSGTDVEWTASRVTRITAQSADTFHASVNMQAGIDVTIEPGTFTLAAGESRDVTITLRARAGELPPASLQTLTFGGTIAFTGQRSTMRVPWVFVHAASVITVSDPFASLTWSCGAEFTGRPAGHGFEVATLLPLRTCSAVSVIHGTGTEGPMVILDERPIRVDETISLGRDRVQYRMTVAGVDEQGRPLRMQSGHIVMHRLSFGPSRLPKELDLGESLLPLQLSAMPDDVTLTPAEVVSDLENHRVVGVQHAPLRGVHGDHTFVNATTDFTKTRVRLLPSTGELGASIMNVYGGIVPPTGARVPLANGWEGDVFVTPSRTPGYDAGPVFATSFFLSAPIMAGSEEIVLGARPLFPRIELLTKETRFGFAAEFAGPMLERHHTVSPRYEARDASGAVVEQGFIEPFTIVDHAGPGAYTLTLRGTGAGVTTYAFDTRRADPIPPSLTSARLVDGELLFTASEPVTSHVSHIGDEIRLEMVDGAGNTCTWVVSVAGGPRKRRAL
jgi:hypothetical protein